MVDDRLHVACETGDLVAVCRLIRTKPELLHLKNHEGNLASWLAAENGHCDIIAELAGFGAVEIDNEKSDNSMVHAAASGGRVGPHSRTGN